VSAGAPIVQERVLEAEPEQVFAAWSDPESLAVWMCPGELTGATAEVDFRVGGRFRIVMHGRERDYAQHGEYLEIDPPKRLVLSWVSEWVPAGEAATRLTLTLEPEAGGRTRLVLVHDGLPPTDSYAGHPDGWSSILTKLASALAATRKEPA
jgi:uncharacterized protein YndB with AHSA1/START domain